MPNGESSVAETPDSVIEHAPIREGRFTEFMWSEDSFDLLFKIENPDADNGSVSEAFGTAIDNMIQDIGLRMIFNGSRLMTMTFPDGRRILNPQEHSRFFPWLPWAGGLVIEGSGGLSLRSIFDLREPLAGQQKHDVSIPLAQLNLIPRVLDDPLRHEELRLMPPAMIGSFELTNMAFEAGSIFGTPRIRRRILATAVAFLGIGFVSDILYAQYEGLRKDHIVSQKIDDAAKGPAAEFCGARLHLDALRHAKERSYDYNEKGISPLERSCRVAQEQLVMKYVLATDLAVDGQLGPETLAHERRLGHLWNTPGTNKNEFFRGKLAQQFPPPESK